MKLKDFVVQNFSGGLVVNKSDFEMQRNELRNTLNLDLDEPGKLKRRRGIEQLGDTKSGTLDNSYVFLRGTNTIHLLADRAATASIYELQTHYNTTAIATTDTTITLGSTQNLTATGTVEIEGDLIAYTGITSPTLTGIAAGQIRVAHPAFSLVSQWGSNIMGAVTIDTRSGAYFTFLNNLCIINGRAGSATYDGTTVTAIADADEPNGIFATNYRDRLYTAGSGTGTGSIDIRRMYFSGAGDATDWNADDFFDVEDDLAEPITGLKEVSDTLLIFKFGSTFVYDEVQLKQNLWGVGAYNHNVIQKINGLLYTFCPSGVWVTNGQSAKKISDPIDKYLKTFKPIYEEDGGRVVTNCFAGQLDGKYYLYLARVPEPEDVTDAVFIYDTVRGNWTIQNSYTNFTHFASLVDIGRRNATTNNIPKYQPAQHLCAGDTGGKYWKLFEKRFIDDQATPAYRGGDITPNLRSNDAGNAISTVAETPFYHLGSLDWKKVGYFTAFIEQGDFQISYRLDRGTEITDWISLGDFTARQVTKRFRSTAQEGYRIAIKVTSNTADVISTFNGFAIRDIETTERRPVIA